MKKTYISPFCEVCQMDVPGELLAASDPATEMVTPTTGINNNTDSYDNPDTDDDDWGY
jgi:hypothetical protein